MNPEEAQITFTSTETFVLPQYPFWGQILFWMIAAGLAVAVFRRERNLQSCFLCIACCCFALKVIPLMLSILFPHSEDVAQVGRMMMIPLLWAEFLGTGFFAAFVFLRWRGR